MDWRSVRFDWNHARAFLVTAEEGSLSSAARALGMAQPTLGRQVAALEAKLGVALFERAGRGLVLTPNGRELLDHVRAMGDAANSMSLAAAGRSQSIEGKITVAASETAAAFILPPIIAKLRKKEPGIDVEIVASNAVSDLQRREADIAMRAFRPDGPELLTRRIRDVRTRLYAAPDYLESIGGLSSPEDLARADFIGFEPDDGFARSLAEHGLEVTAGNFPLFCLNQLVQWELVKQGLGIGLMLEQAGDSEPGVVRALPSLEPICFPTWLTAHREVRTSLRVRKVFDLIVEELG